MLFTFYYQYKFSSKSASLHLANCIDKELVFCANKIHYVYSTHILAPRVLGVNFPQQWESNLAFLHYIPKSFLRQGLTK